MDHPFARCKGPGWLLRWATKPVRELYDERGEARMSRGNAEVGGPLGAPRHEDRSGGPPSNLPAQLTSLVGREQEISEVGRLLAEHRLLTLTGPGGCGKTRLALAVGAGIVGGFEDGVWLVELASLSDPDLIAQEVASVLGVREQHDLSLEQALAEHLGARRVLLILDNCEHLIDACAELAGFLLRACPDLRILATSREALGITGEVAWPVPPLSFPDLRHLPAAEGLERYEAAKLFADRSVAVKPSFAITERNAAAVAQVLYRLDGIPLAIELAAARVKALSVEQISSRLDDSFGLLAAGSRTALPHHQTLRATMDWSHGLLSGDEQVLFRRLSVFAGGSTLEAAEAVCGGDGLERGRVLDLLGRLVDKSLVVAEVGDENGLRYRMLEPVRQYGLERLEAATGMDDQMGEAEAVRRRHAAWFLGLAEEAEPGLSGAQQGAWLERLESDHGNLRAALGWSLEGGDAGLGLRMAGVLGGFWYKRGYLSEGRRWLERELAGSSASPVFERARALDQAGWMALYQGDLDSSIALLEEGLGLFKELGDESGVAASLAKLGHAVLHQDDREHLAALCEEAEAMRRSFADRRAIGELLVFLGMVALYEEDLDRAATLLEESLDLFGEMMDGTRGVSDAEEFSELSTAIELVAGQAQEYLWLAALEGGDHDRAISLLEEELRALRKLGNKPKTSYCLLGLAAVAALQGRPARAVQLWVAAETLREEIGLALVLWDHTPTDYGALLAATHSQLGETAWETARAEGRAMTLEQAVALALNEPETTREDGGQPTPGDTASAEPPAPPELRIFALGPARVERGEHTIASSEWTYAKPRELLYYLLSHSSRTKEQIGLDLWPEASPSRLRGNFHEALRRLRKALGGPEWVSFEGGRYAFDRSLPYSFDVEDFESKLEEARRLGAEAPVVAISALEEAVALYEGDFLEYFLGSEWVLVRQEELRREHLEALLTLGALRFGEERHAEAAEAYRKVVALDGYSEGAHRELMRSYAAAGERGQAIRHYQTLVEKLQNDLGSQPTPETRALYEALLRGEDT